MNIPVGLWKDGQGEDLVEYALPIVLIPMEGIVAIGCLASAISEAFSNAATNLSPATS